MYLKNIAVTAAVLLFFACSDKRAKTANPELEYREIPVTHASGFQMQQRSDGVRIIEVRAPWPEAETGFRYALVARNRTEPIQDAEEFDAVIRIPVERLVVTSTTHIPALELLDSAEKLVGFPETDYISSTQTRDLIDAGKVAELGTNEAINTEMVIALKPELVVGFGISAQNKAYTTIQNGQIPVVYNGDWVEETPLGKAEWLRFLAPFIGKEKEADSLFRAIVDNYEASRKLAAAASRKPTVLSGGLYKDVWYLPGGDSWAARFIKDAHAEYLWADSPGTGSLSLSIEAVLERGIEAEFWISPSQYKSYAEMESQNRHYSEFQAFNRRNVYTFALTTGATGGLLYYELAPSRPDLVLRDLIHIFHPELLPEHQPFFFKPLR